ncbi:DUF3828 domain-containing protein [Novosphingobium album (ex Liu et al. 2023)]|uniref:DUF3828 domain-containing protein n=1 Tax=Novosphingobium album (ex Liu et al. 2023) TaxID=3031130 RepID=A0ABT5WW32_9SPHN|nr:DUF3828 domain-containing protein [Novosphingobium album (ex Liu et al. 2023)]MDE8654114.1 DUF3828 domain-containing protein [Novosphingobium album (ex Liu et al. 2023)]
MKAAAAVLVFLACGTACEARPVDPALDQAVKAIYAPYAITSADGTYPPTAWERPLYSKDVTALISRWEAVMPEDDVDDLNDGDWLCMCQDWDSRVFKADVLSTAMTGADAAHVVVSVAVFGTETRKAELDFRREDGAWKLDEMTSEQMPRGLKQALRETIAKDEAR